MNTVEIVEALAAAASTDLGKRKIEASVRLHDDATGDSDGVYLVLGIKHWPDSKAFAVNIHIETRKSERGFTTSFWEPMNTQQNMRLAPFPVPRYSAKSLQKVWEEVIAGLREAPAALNKLDLNFKAPEPEPEAEAGWFFGRDLIQALKAEGVDETWVWQSGGGTATFCIPNEGGMPMLIGPGSYNWNKPELSQFTMDELYYGLDYDDYTEKYDEEPESFTVPKDSTIPDAAKAIAAKFQELKDK